MPSTGLPHPFGSLPGHSVVLSSRVSPSPLCSFRFRPPLVELHPGPIPQGPPGRCRCMLILQLLRGVMAFPLPRPSTPCLRSSVLHLHSSHGCGSQLTNSSCFPGTRWLLAPQVPRQTGTVDHPTRQPVIRHLPCLDLLAFQELPLHKPRPSQQKF